VTAIDQYFQTDDLKDDLRRRSVHGAAITVSSLAGKFLVNVGSTMVLARLLTPQDFGLVTMVLTVTVMIMIFRDLGLATATIQSPSLDHSRVNTLFWLNVLFGLAVGGFTALTSPLLAWFFREPRLTAIGIVLGGTMLIDGLAVQHQALLRRRMRFGALALSDVASNALGALFAVFLAQRGADYWALVWMRVVSAATGAAFLWIQCSWRPSLSLRIREAQSLVMFGGKITASRLVRYSSRNVDRLLIGRFLGADVLGLYAKASGWLAAPFQQLNWPLAWIAVPILSRLQNEPQRFRLYYRAGLSILAMFGLPLIFYLFIDAPPVIQLLLGPQWTQAIPIFRLLAPVAFAALLQIAFHWSYISLGNADRQVKWEIFSAAITLIALVVGLRWGVNGIAAAYSLASILLLPVGAVYCTRGTPVGVGDLVFAFLRPAAASLGASLVLILFIRRVAIESDLAAVVSHALIFFAAYAALWLISPGGPRAAREFLRLGKEFQKFKRSPP
jgi:PST family polysaccharide transporter